MGGTVFVLGIGKRKNRNQRYLELFRQFLERQTSYDWHVEKKLRAVAAGKQNPESTAKIRRSTLKTEETPDFWL